jgi:hypothetical protein
MRSRRSRCRCATEVSTEISTLTGLKSPIGGPQPAGGTSVSSVGEYVNLCLTAAG